MWRNFCKGKIVLTLTCLYCCSRTTTPTPGRLRQANTTIPYIDPWPHPTESNLTPPFDQNINTWHSKASMSLHLRYVIDNSQRLDHFMVTQSGEYYPISMTEAFNSLSSPPRNLIHIEYLSNASRRPPILWIAWVSLKCVYLI